MRSTRKATLLSLLSAALIFQPVTTLSQKRTAQTRPAGPGRQLHALFDSEWEWTMREFPTFASSLGDRR
jgi:hypothetical protein